LGHRQEKDGTVEKLEALNAQKALLAGQIADLTATIAAAEKKKEKETASRAKAVLVRLQAEEKELDEQISATMAAIAHSGAPAAPASSPTPPTPAPATPSSNGSPTPSPAQSPPSLVALESPFALRRTLTTPTSTSALASHQPSQQQPPLATVVLRHVPESAKSPQARISVRASPLAASVPTEGPANSSIREKGVLMRTSRVLSLGTSAAEAPTPSVVASAVAVTGGAEPKKDTTTPQPPRSSTPPATTTTTTTTASAATHMQVVAPPSLPSNKPRYKCATIHSNQVPLWMREDLAKTDPADVRSGDPDVSSRTGAGSTTQIRKRAGSGPAPAAEQRQ